MSCEGYQWQWMIQAESTQIEVSHEKTRFYIKKRAFQELRRVVHDDGMLKFLQTSSFYFIALHMMELQKKSIFWEKRFLSIKEFVFWVSRRNYVY